MEGLSLASLGASKILPARPIHVKFQDPQRSRSFPSSFSARPFLVTTGHAGLFVVSILIACRAHPPGLSIIFMSPTTLLRCCRGVDLHLAKQQCDARAGMLHLRYTQLETEQKRTGCKEKRTVNTQRCGNNMK